MASLLSLVPTFLWAGVFLVGCGGRTSIVVVEVGAGATGNTSGANEGGAPKQTGPSCAISAAQYDQTCSVDSDCVGVNPGNYCAQVPQCGPCGPTAAINIKAVTQFNTDADVQRRLSGSSGVGGVACCTPGPAVLGPCCRAGTCQLGDACAPHSFGMSASGSPAGLPLGRVWYDTEAAGNCHGVWTRLGDTNQFSATWPDCHVTAQLTIVVVGQSVTLSRTNSSDGNDCNYVGVLALGGNSVSGTYSCARISATPPNWSAIIQ